MFDYESLGVESYVDSVHRQNIELSRKKFGKSKQHDVIECECGRAIEASRVKLGLDLCYKCACKEEEHSLKRRSW
jgi:hypothetical protein